MLVCKFDIVPYITTLVLVLAIDKTTFSILTKVSWLILTISDEIHFRPFFDESSQEVTVQEGSAAYFNCKVFNIVNETVNIYA